MTLLLALSLYCAPVERTVNIDTLWRPHETKATLILDSLRRVDSNKINKKEKESIR